MKKAAFVILGAVLLLFPLVLAIMNQFSGKPGEPTRGVRDFLPRRPTPTASPDDTVVSEQSNPDGAVSRVEYGSGRHYFSLSGTVAEEETQLSDRMEFPFFADADEQRYRMPVEVVFDGEDLFPVAFFESSFDGAYTTKRISKDTLSTLIFPGVRVQLRIMVRPGSSNAQTQTVGRLLDAVLSGKSWQAGSEQVTFSPSGLGLIR